MNRQGVTLIELLIVIAVIGILATIAIPAYVGQQLRAQRSEAYANLQNLRLLQEQHFAENQSYSTIGGLPGWKPGTDLKFDYAVTAVTGVGLPTPVPSPYADTTAALTPVTTPCFIATATGKTGTRVHGDKFAIDCNNSRNF